MKSISQSYSKAAPEVIFVSARLTASSARSPSISLSLYQIQLSACLFHSYRTMVLVNVLLYLQDPHDKDILSIYLLFSHFYKEFSFIKYTLRQISLHSSLSVTKSAIFNVFTVNSHFWFLYFHLSFARDSIWYGYLILLQFLLVIGLQSTVYFYFMF